MRLFRSLCEKLFAPATHNALWSFQRFSHHKAHPWQISCEPFLRDRSLLQCFFGAVLMLCSYFLAASFKLLLTRFILADIEIRRSVMFPRSVLPWGISWCMRSFTRYMSRSKAYD